MRTVLGACWIFPGTPLTLLEARIEPGPFVVSGDAGRLQQVFWNLLSNAIKFTPSVGCISLKTSSDSVRFVLEMTDTGVGFEPEMSERIFVPFEQAERTITRQFGGLGLGLAISKSLIEMQGGEIKGESSGTGKGATFRISLPCFDPANAPEVKAGKADKQVPARKARILMVEDHMDTADVMRRLLRRRGHAVQHASTKAEALELGLSEDFDILVSDIGLPDGSGLELMKELRATIPIKGIALSGFGLEADMERSREAGYSEHLIKPISISDLTEAIERALTESTS